MKFFEKADVKDLQKSVMTATNLVTQALEVAIGARVRFDELKITAGKLQKDGSNEYRTVKLDGVLATGSPLDSGRRVCSISLRKDKGGAWMPTDEGACIERLCDTLWTAYWHGCNPRDVVSPVSVFEAHNVKAQTEPIWSVGHTALDRVQFKRSELPQLIYPHDYRVDGCTRFVVSEKFQIDMSNDARVKIRSTSDYFKRHFLNKVEGHADEHSLCIQCNTTDARDITIPLVVGIHLCETTLHDLYSMLLEHDCSLCGIVSWIRDDYGVLQMVFANSRTTSDWKICWNIDAKPIGNNKIGSGSKIVSMAR